MSGIYFIAAGKSSRNREKSLNQGLRVADVARLLGCKGGGLSDRYSGNDTIFAWGANRVGDLTELEAGDFVVDVKNKEVVQVFEFGHWIETTDTRLQEFIGWDAEKPREQRRPYKIVYFLTQPRATSRRKKTFFQRAFNQEANQNWLVGQRWFSPSDVQSALGRSSTQSIEHFLGIETGSETLPEPETEQDLGESIRPVQRDAHSRFSSEIERKPENFEKPTWLLPVIQQVEMLREDPEHQERDHEDLVARFFESLGYQRTRDIKYRRGRVDILIEQNEEPLIVVEVKRDWSLSKSSKDYVRQAFNYALENGAQYVAVTNGDLYVFYDRRKGLSYDDHLVAEFQLSRLTPGCLSSISDLRPGTLQPSE